MAAVNNGPAADQPSQMRREHGGGGMGGGRLIARESLAGKRRYQPTIRSFRFLATMADTNKHRVGTGRCPTTNFESVERKKKKKKERKALSGGRERGGEGERTEKRSHPGRCIAFFALSVTKKPCPRANLSLVFFSFFFLFFFSNVERCKKR